MFPVSANPRARTSKRGGRNRANARNTGTKYDAKPESPGMAFRTRTTSGPKPKPTLFTKYSPQTSPASRSEERRVGKECRGRWSPERVQEEHSGGGGAGRQSGHSRRYV